MSKIILQPRKAKKANRLRYKTVREKRNSDELGSYVTYGIIIYKNKKLLKYISDVSNIKRDVQDLVRRCNEEQLDPIHIEEVVDDYLTDLIID